MTDAKEFLFSKEKREKQVTVEKESFTLTAITSREQKQIARKCSLEQNGLPANSFSGQDQYIFARDAALDVCIVAAPDWWENLEGAEDCPNEDLKDALYDELQKWTSKYQKELKKNKPEKRSKES